MISSDILNRLNSLGFGADINKLETYVGELKDSINLDCPMGDYSDYIELSELLRQLKPASRIIQTDLITTQHTLPRGTDLSPYLASQSSTQTELLGYIQCEGITTNLEYKNGELHRVTIQLESRELDITTKRPLNIPKTVTTWVNIPSIVITGKCCITHANSKQIQSSTNLKNTAQILTHYATTFDYTNIQPKIDYIANEIHTGNPYNTQWETINNLKYLGFMAPQKIKASGVSVGNIQTAADRIIQYFDNLSKTGELNYTYTGVELWLSDTSYTDQTQPEHHKSISIQCLQPLMHPVYSSKVSGIRYDTGIKNFEPVLVLGGQRGVKELAIPDIGYLLRNEIETGSTIYYTTDPQGTPIPCSQAGDLNI